MPGGFPEGQEICNATDIGTALGSSSGVTVTGGNLAEGSWAQLTASAPHDACMILVNIFPPAGSSNIVAVDIGVGSSGNEQVLAQQLMACTNTGNNTVVTYMIPCTIKAGQRIAARSFNSGAADTLQVSVILLEGSFPHLEGAAGVDAIGFVPASDTGTIITPGATANVKTAFAQLTAATLRDYIGFFFANTITGQGASISGFYGLLDIAIGSSGNEIVILPNFAMAGAGNSYVFPVSSPIIPIPIPAGSRISARAQSSITSGDSFGVILYGIYK